MGKINNVLSSEQKEEMVSLYLSGLSTTELSKRYGICSNAIRGNLQRRKVQFRTLSESHKKYKINESFFDDINTEEKAYILGLFYADGSNNLKRHKAYIMLAEQDKDILEKIQNIISPDKPLLFSKRKDNNPNHQDRFMFYIDNKHISIQLDRLGCVTNKTHKLIFPEWLSKNLYNHFIRGYFDGDGHIGLYNKKARFSIVGTEAFCNSIKEIFNNLNINSSIYCRFPERNNNTRDIRVSGNKQILKLLDWIYKDSTIYMNRKYCKYLDLMRYYE